MPIVTKLSPRTATTFLFLVLNATWALMAYLLHTSGVHPPVIATVVAIGLLFGNLAAFAGLRFAKKLQQKRLNSN
jgi:uncharacterized membrane protein YfcA